MVDTNGGLCNSDGAHIRVPGGRVRLSPLPPDSKWAESERGPHGLNQRYQPLNQVTLLQRLIADGSPLAEEAADAIDRMQWRINELEEALATVTAQRDVLAAEVLP